MARICFVSYEIHPTTWGGCGVLLHNAARVLLAQGHEVIFLLDVPEEYFRRFCDQDRLKLPHPERCRAYHVDSLCRDIRLKASDFPGAFAWKAWRFHVACRQVYAAEQPDVIEFFDYCGVAHYALAAKATGLDYQHSHLAIRLHNSIEMMDLHEATQPLSLDRYILYAMEHAALRLAESVLYPSDSYLQEGCKRHYEAWFGHAVRSQPPLVVRPQAAPPGKDADIVLFYGRLYAWKGVDLFVDAAVAYLENPANPRLQFYLVGNDSGQPPIDVPDYRTYLLRKIPRKHRESFVFTGWLAWNDFAELLPRVRLGVFPSYFESFCYALHEVYLAKVPVIVSNRPGTKDFFRHEENSLLFDGSVDDLTRQMERLAGDADLRSRLACPYPVATDPLGSFYEGPRAESWIRWGTPERPSLLVCVIEEKGEPRPPVLEPLAASQLQNMRVVRLCPADDSGDQAAAWLLGGLYTLHAQDGAPLLPTEVRTSQSLLIVRGSDMPSPGFLGRCLDTLARQPQIGFVGSWKRIVDGAEVRTDVFPLDAALELVPLRGGTPLSRCMVRTPEGKLLLDLFPTNAGRWGEMAYLWDLDTGARCGITIPEVLMTQQAEHEGAIALPTLSYLVLRDQSAWRKTRLAKYLLTMRGQAATPSPPPQPAPQPEQPLGQSAGNFPGRALRYAKRTVRHALRKLRDAPLKIAQLFKLFLYGS